VPVVDPVAPQVPAARSVAIVTLGCGRNEVDSEQLAGLFHRAGTTVLEDPAEADVVLVNTCTFIAPAKQESIDTVLAACQLKDDGGTRAVLVVGCMAQRYPQELAEAIPEADAIVGFDGYARLPAIVEQALAGELPDRVVGVGPAHPGSRTRRDLPLLVAPSGAQPEAAPAGAAGSRDADLVLGLRVVEQPPGARSGPGTQDALDRVPPSGPRFEPRHRTGAARSWSYLKIASGCDRVCTFCAIPSFRGRFRSRPLDELVAEAGWLAGQGVRELVLVSENTTSWGKDLPGGRDLQPQLVRALAAIAGIERLRFMYLQPAELTNALLEAIAGEPKVAGYYDLSLQHVSGPVVARMGRSGDHERFGALIRRIREQDPDAVFRSNFILGFPGETDADVQRLEDFLTEHRLDWVGFFAFSREDGTPSHDLPDQVADAVARDRLGRMSALQERIADAAATRWVGRQLDVLVDGVGDDGTPVGRSFREAPDTDGDIELVGPDGVAGELPVGRIVQARVTGTVGVDLVAEVVGG